MIRIGHPPATPHERRVNHWTVTASWFVMFVLLALLVAGYAGPAR